MLIILIINVKIDFIRFKLQSFYLKKNTCIQEKYYQKLEAIADYISSVTYAPFFLLLDACNHIRIISLHSISFNLYISRTVLTGWLLPSYSVCRTVCRTK